MNDDRAVVERSANEVRAQLRETLEVIDRRRHDLLDPRRQLEEHRTAIAIATGVTLVGLGALVGYAIHRASTREERARARRGRELRRAMRRAYLHPEWIARRAMRREDVQARVAKSALSTALTFAAFELATSTVRRALERPRTSAVPAPGA